MPPSSHGALTVRILRRQALSLLLPGDGKRLDNSGQDGDGAGNGISNGNSDGNGNAYGGDGNGGGNGSGDGGGDGDAALPGSGLRLAVVFNPSTGAGEAQGGDGDGGAAARLESAGRWLPAVFEAVGSRAPDKVRGAPCRAARTWVCLRERGKIKTAPLGVFLFRTMLGYFSVSGFIRVKRPQGETRGRVSASQACSH